MYMYLYRCVCIYVCVLMCVYIHTHTYREEYLLNWRLLKAHLWFHQILKLPFHLFPRTTETASSKAGNKARAEHVDSSSGSEGSLSTSLYSGWNHSLPPKIKSLPTKWNARNQVRELSSLSHSRRLPPSTPHPKPTLRSEALSIHSSVGWSQSVSAPPATSSPPPLHPGLCACSYPLPHSRRRALKLVSYKDPLSLSCCLC